jgi:hypothetical protein
MWVISWAWAGAGVEIRKEGSAALSAWWLGRGMDAAPEPSFSRLIRARARFRFRVAQDRSVRSRVGADRFGGRVSRHRAGCLTASCAWLTARRRGARATSGRAYRGELSGHAADGYRVAMSR